MPTLEFVVISRTGIPDRPYFHLSSATRYLGRLPVLFVDVGLNYLRRQTRG